MCEVQPIIGVGSIEYPGLSGNYLAVMVGLAMAAIESSSPS